MIKEDRVKYMGHSSNPFTQSNKEMQFILKLYKQFKPILYSHSKLPFLSNKSSNEPGKSKFHQAD